MCSSDLFPSHDNPAYFNRWVRKNFPCYEDYDFTVYRYSSMYDMLHDERQISSYELVIVD